MTKSDLSQYLSEIGRYPVLSREGQLLHCRNIHRYQQWPGGKEQAPRKVVRAAERGMEMMVTTNLRLVVSIAKKYQDRGVDLQDLIQEGNIGLIRGLELFDPARGYQVSTYCYWWVRQGVARAIHAQSRMIRLPINSHEQLVKMRRCQQRHLSEHGVSAPVSVLADYMEMTEKRVKELISHWENTQCRSLDISVTNTGSDRDVLLKDTIPSTEPDRNRPSELKLSDAGDARLQYAIANNLTDKEQRVIAGYFEDGRTIKHIAEHIQVSPASVGQIKERAINKLKKAMAC